MSQPPTYEASAEPSRPPPPPRIARVAALSALLTFTCFAGYAFLSPATYRATAVMAIDAPAGKETTSKGPLEAARRLQETVLDREVLQRLAAEQEPGAASDVHIQVARAIQASLQVDSLDSRIFTLSYKDRDRQRAAARCNALAERAIERGPLALASELGGEQRELEAEWRKRVDALVTFVGDHPELLNETPGSGAGASAAPSGEADKALRAERVRIEAQLTARAAARSDNPYDDAARTSENAPLLKRLTQINTLLGLPKPAPNKGQAPATTPAVLNEWQRLVAAVSEARAAAEAAKNAPNPLKARMVARAEVPSWPLDPDRGALLLWGALASLIAAIASGLGARALSASAAMAGSVPPPSNRRRASSHPPSAGRYSSQSDGERGPPGARTHYLSEPPAPVIPRREVSSSAPPAPNASSSAPPAPNASSAPPAPIASSAPPAPNASSAPPMQASSSPPSKITAISATPNSVTSSAPPDAAKVSASDSVPSARIVAVNAAPVTATPVATSTRGPTRSTDPTSEAKIVPTRSVRIESSNAPPAAKPGSNSAPRDAKSGATSAPRDAKPSAKSAPVAAKPSPNSGPVAPRPNSNSGPVAPRPSSNNAQSAPRSKPSSAPPANRSERSLRAAVEVNAAQPAGTAAPKSSKSSSPPGSVPLSARATQVLGSPIVPILAPGARRTPAAGGTGRSSSNPVPGKSTGYSYVSTPPPPAGRTPTSAPPNSQPPATPRSSSVMAQPAPNGWRPDLSLLPEGRRALCKDLYPQAVDACAVVAVIGGTRRDDGKSRLAAELSLALAESGHPRVLLLEGDLSRPMVQRFLRIEMPEGQGLSEQLKSRIDEQSSRPWLVVECSPTLHVLCEGKGPAPELILSRPFEACLDELRSYYDFILIDGPPVSDVSACRAVRDVIDSAILVRAENGGTELAEATSLFPDRRISVVSVPGNASSAS